MLNPEVEEALVPDTLLVGDAVDQVIVGGVQERIQFQDVLLEARKVG